MKKILRNISNKFGYDIVKNNNYGINKYKSQSDEPGLDFFDTPLGKYYLPGNAPRDIVAAHIKKGVCFEKEVFEECAKYIKPGTVFLDIGANYGQMSILLSRQMKNATIYAFEAEPFVFSILEKNIKANGCDNIKAIYGAVHNKGGEELFFPEPDFQRFDSYGSYGIDVNASAGRKVKSIAIDDLNIEEKISCMKIDIQGSDLFALQGAKETILKNKMPIIFEFEQQFQNEFNTSFDDYVDYIKSVGYSFSKIILDINYLVTPEH